MGHEPDVTIADFVADLRAATPSNAAELAVPEWEAVSDSLLDDRLRLGQAVHKKLERSAQRLESLASRPIMASPLAFVQQRRLDLDRLAERLEASEKQVLSENRQTYIRLASSLEALSPLKVLSRGYSLVMDPDGNVIRRAQCVNIGQAVHIRLLEGSLDCRVENRTED